MYIRKNYGESYTFKLVIAVSVFETAAIEEEMKERHRRVDKTTTSVTPF